MSIQGGIIRKWTLFCAFGELSGIAIAGLIAFAVNHTIGEPQTLPEKLLVLTAMLIAGAIEGSLLGWFQWRVLRRLVNVGIKEWVGITVLVAVLGWLLGMLPSLFFIPQQPAGGQPANVELSASPFVFGALCIGIGLVLGAVFGSFQYIILKKYAANAAWWIVANALGWGAGIGWIYLAASIPNEESALWVNVAVGAAGGILAGISVGLITGLFFKKLQFPARQELHI